MKETLNLTPAPELTVSRWFNTTEDLTLEKLRGKVVLIEAFQMLCPGCVSHGLPQASRVHDSFPTELVSVIGLHTVFEHHAAMTAVSLEAFLFEYGIGFPVAVDSAGDQGIPRTMDAYSMRGTPTLLLIDPAGNLQAQYFGQVPDLRLGAEIATLLADSGKAAVAESGRRQASADCAEDGCTV